MNSLSEDGCSPLSRLCNRDELVPLAVGKRFTL